MSDKFPNVPTWPGKTGYYEGPIPLPTTPPVRTQPCATPEGEPADEPYSMDDEGNLYRYAPAASQAPAPDNQEAGVHSGNAECARCGAKLWGRKTYWVPSGSPLAQVLICESCADKSPVTPVPSQASAPELCPICNHANRHGPHGCTHENKWYGYGHPPICGCKSERRVAASQAPAPERPEPTWQDVLEGKDKQILKLLATQALLLDDRDAWKARAEAAEKLASKRFEQVGEMATRSELDDRKIERLESENAQLRAEITHPVKPLQYDDCYDELRRHLSADLGLGIMAVRPEVLRRVLEYHDSLIASLPAPPSERDAQEGR